MKFSGIKGLLFAIALFFYVDGYGQIIRTLAGTGNIAASATDGNSGPAILSPVSIPYGVATDNKGNLYISDQLYHTVRKIRKDGTILPWAGRGSVGSPGAYGDNGPATLAYLNTPSGMVCDAIGNLYIADQGHNVVRRVDTFGVIHLVAGVYGALGVSGNNGPATAAHLGAAAGICLDAAGNLYIANGNSVVWKVTIATGIINIVAGGVGVGFTGNGGQATAAAMEGVTDVCVDANYLYISEQVNSCVRKISLTTGIISAYAGIGTSAGTTGDLGQATAAKLNSPVGLKMDAAGNMYICDGGSNRIRKVTTATGIITTYSGGSTAAGFAGDGLAYNNAAVRYQRPTTVCFDALGHMFISDQGGGYVTTIGGRRIREIFKVDTFHVAVNPSNNVCAGAADTFTANAAGSYYSFQYNWKVNGVAVAGATSATFMSSTIANNDRVSCTITDTANGGMLLAVSDTVVMTVHALLTPSVSLVSTADTVCAGTAITVTAAAANGGTAPHYQWQVSGVNVATATSYSYTPANGDTVTCILTSSEACVTTNNVRASKIIRVNPMPFAGLISGPTFICAGSMASLTTTGNAGGTWLASNGSATVSGTGVVTAVSAGVDTITYKITTPTCGIATATWRDTISAMPNAGSIVGLNTVCPGYSISLTNAATGGTWSISNAHATITGIGVVTGVSTGSDTVKYTVTNACGTAVASTIITVGVSSLHSAGTITGASSVCLSASATLSDTATGGFWSSTDPSVSVSASGVVTGVSAGSATIYYIVPSGCSPDTASHAITVLPTLSAGTISGVSTACAGSTVTLTNTVSSGVWSSDNTAVASVDTAGRVTVGIPGVAVISYIASNSCGSDTDTHTITVAPVPFADTITGVSFLCGNTSTTLTDTASGGVWSSSAPGIATVNASGVVTSLASGSITISYSVTNSCGSDITLHHITINPFPVLTSTATPPAVCSGSPFNYTPTSSTPGALFSWTRPAIPGILNPTASSIGDPNEILLNNTTSPIGVVYIFGTSAGGCSTVQNVTVSVKPIPKLSGSDTITTCAGRNFYYLPTSATAGTTYVWTRAAVSGVSPATASGAGAISETLTTGASSVGVVYAFTLTAAGCTNPESLTVIIEPQGPPPPMITTRSPSWVCANTMYQNFGTSSVPDSTVTYDWTASNAAVWAQGAGHQYSIINFTNPGLAIVYLSTSTVGYSCRSIDSFAVYVDMNPNELPTVNYFGGVLIAQSGMSAYQWGYDDATTLDSTILTGESNATYTPSSPDFVNKHYWVMTEHLLCKQKTYYNAPTAVANVNAGGIKDVSVYPNPGNGEFTLNISSDFTEQGTIAITNMVGAKVMEQSCSTNKKTELSVDQPAGIYFVTVSTAHGKHTTKIVISKQ